MMFPLLLFIGWALLSFGVPVFFHMPLGAHLGFVSNLLVWTGVAGLVLWAALTGKGRGAGRPGLLLALVCTAGLLAALASSTEPLRAGEFHTMAGGVAPGETGLETLVRPETLLRVSTRTMAWQVANKALGGEVTLDGRTLQLTSQFEIDAARGTLVRLADPRHQGLYWIFALDYSGLFPSMDLPWVPGYVLLSATDPSARPELVTDQKLRYTPNAFFDRGLEFKTYWAHPDLQAEETHLELDDGGRPWWVTTYVSPRVGLAGYDVSHIALTDPETGAETFLTWADWLSRAREFAWVDRVIPESLASRRLDAWWSLGGGWLNSVGLPGTNVMQRTPYSGNELWFLPLEGRSVWLSGITSMNNKDYSLVNFSLVDTRTEALQFIKVKGTEEDGAVRMTQGALGANASIWRPVLPTPVVLDGEPWWSLTIVDSQDLFRAVALLKLDSTNQVFFGSTFAEAKAQAGQGPAPQEGDTEPMVTVTLSKGEYEFLKMILKKLEAADR